MKRPHFGRILLALAVVAAASCGSPQDELGSPEQAGSDIIAIGGEGRPRSLDEALDGESRVPLWRVADEDTTVFLLGTVHMIARGIPWKTESIAEAFRSADAAYLTADILSRDAQRAMGMVVSDRAENPAGRTLSSFYSSKERSRINELLGGFDLSLSELDDFRPWFAAMQVGLASVMKAGGDPEADADVVIAREMLQRDVPIRYLESAAQQFSLLAAGDDRADARFLLSLLEDLGKGEAYYADLVAAWYGGDTERLDFILGHAFRPHPKLHERLVVDRNLDWAQKIDRLLTDEPGTFVVAVGAEHLVGESSVQATLEGRGYVVSRVE